MVKITPIGGKTNGGGYGTTSILTEYNTTIYYESDNKTEFQIDNIKYINISTYYSNAWSIFINSILKNKLAESEFFIDVQTDNMVNIQFNITGITLKYKIVEIYAQIGPGWVE
jgi:hypothetical protein